MDEEEITDEEAAQAVMLRISEISEALTVLFTGWFSGMIELNAKEALRGLAVWRILGEELEDLVWLVFETFGDGGDFETALKNQEKDWADQARRIEELNEKLEGLRKNAKNN